MALGAEGVGLNPARRSLVIAAWRLIEAPQNRAQRFPRGVGFRAQVSAKSRHSLAMQRPSGRPQDLVDLQRLEDLERDDNSR